MKLLGLNNVVVLSPHPDDAEYSISATVSKYYDTTFHILTMSNGGNYDDTVFGNRDGEARRFWSLNHNVEFHSSLDLSSGFLSESKEDLLVHRVESIMSTLTIDAVFVPPQLDSHFEHRLINNVGRAVCRIDRISLIEYHTPSTMNTWTANFYVSVDDHVTAKKRRLRDIFKSQATKHYFSNKALDAFHSDYFCEKRGVGAVEKYRIDSLFDSADV